MNVIKTGPIKITIEGKYIGKAVFKSSEDSSPEILICNTEIKEGIEHYLEKPKVMIHFNCGKFDFSNVLTEWAQL